MIDNLKGIYSTQLNSHLLNQIENDKQWLLVPYPEEIKLNPEDLEESKDNVKKILKRSGADAVMTSRISKGPKGITIKINLFSGEQGLLLAQQVLSDYSGFETADLKNKIQEQYKLLKQKIPYDGVVLSRKGLLVTINMGKSEGLLENSELSVIQIYKVTRHPKFNFIIGTEKEILGKIKIQKVDEHLSFGSIISEKDDGVIQKNQKFIVDRFVVYPESAITADGKVIDNLNAREDLPVSFGNKAREWLPDNLPTYGRLGVMLGLGTYSIGNNLTAAGGVAATNSLIPSIQGSGEIWINPEWLIHFNLRQFVFSVSNPYPGSAPSRLNVSTSQYTLQFGHNFLLEEKFFGPKVQLLAGYSKLSGYIDQSTPTAFTSMAYSGFLLGIGGSFPLSLESKLPLSLGARLNLYMSPSLDESPVTSGNPTNQISSFNTFAEYRYSNRINIKFALDYDLFSSTFSGSGTRAEAATSASHTMTTVSTGIEYLF